MTARTTVTTTIKTHMIMPQTTIRNKRANKQASTETKTTVLLLKNCLFIVDVIVVVDVVVVVVVVVVLVVIMTIITMTTTNKGQIFNNKTVTNKRRTQTDEA